MTEPDQQPVAEEGSEATSGDRAGPILYWTGLIGLLVFTIAAGLGRLLALDRVPGGLIDAEARHGTLARESQTAGLRWLIEGAGDLSIPLATLIRLVGELTAFDATAPRMAAAILGAGSVLATGLWLRRDMGPLWGLAGAAVLAGSFWHLLFSRLGIGQIAGTLALAGMLWAIAEARSRSGAQAIPWYVLAGFSSGAGFLATPALRLLPLALLGILAVSLYRHWREPGHAEPGHWLAASAAAWVTISPFLIANRGDRTLWTPWTPTPGLPGADRVDLATFPGALIESFTALTLPRDIDRGLNLPGDAWFSLLMLPWAVIGLLGLISLSNDPRLRDRFLGGAAGLALVWIGISAVDAGHPGQLVVISPLLAGLVIYGFRSAIDWARMPTVRVVLILLIVTGIAGEAFVSTDRYMNEWADSPETRAAMNVSIVETLTAVENLSPGDEPVFVSLTNHQELLSYFVTTTRRHTFDGSAALPFPAEENGYLAIPHAEPLIASLEPLLEDTALITIERGDSGYSIYRLDDRIREQLPFGIPTHAYAAGPVLYGGQLDHVVQRTATVRVAWNLPAQSPGYQVDVQLAGTTTGTQNQQVTIDLPENPLNTRLFQVLAVELEIPDEVEEADLGVRLRDADGQTLVTDGVDEDAFILLNRYVISD